MITSTNNAKVKYVRRLQRDNRFRRKERSFVVEGNRLLGEVARTQNPPTQVLFTQAWAEVPANRRLLQSLEAPAFSVSDEVFHAMSDTESPQGVLAVLPIQERALPEPVTFLLILDRVRTPGNLGTMLRTAAAAGCDGVVLSPGCVDPYNPKVIRGGMGAHLRLPLLARDWPEISLMTETIKAWTAEAEGVLPYTDVNWRQPSALIIGSEASGVSAEARRVADGSIYIPMFRRTESLNAAIASAVILFEAARQRR
jgi:TrmH family RNA methyltransferase